MGEKRNTILLVLKRFLLWLLVTVMILLAAAYGLMYILVNGPSPAAKKLFVRSVRETSAVYWLADLFCSEEEIAQLENVGAVETLEQTDTNLVTVSAPQTQGEKPKTDEWGLTDEDGDGLIFAPVSGSGYVGYMMVVLDPSRLMLGTPERFGMNGMTVPAMCEKYGCIAGINGGGFEDENGKGNGGTPIGMTVLDGEVYYASEFTTSNFVGFDDHGILHTGLLTPKDVRDNHIQFGCTFGPVLICNGEKNNDGILSSGVNPRTAIGQRPDGAVLMLVVDGRQAHSIGATYADMADVMLEFGAVNACNLDGGSSSVLWHDGEYINHCASVIGFRPIPTAFLVKEVG